MFRLLISILFFSTLILPQTVFAKSKIDKARDLAKIEMNHEAKALLKQAIMDDPLDADVHYEVGLVYRQLGMTRDFDLAMKNTCKLKSSYCPKVAEPYYAMAFNDLSRRNQGSAIRSFKKAFAYQPAKKAEALSRLMGYGKAQLPNNRDVAEEYLSALAHFDPSAKDKIATLYYEAGQEVNAGADQSADRGQADRQGHGRSD